MPFRDIYRDQVKLLIRTLPYVAEEQCFALKGGTAINLFVRDMPRLSVDIDLTYLPLNDRNAALDDIESALMRIGDRIKRADPAMVVTSSAPGTQTQNNRLVARTRERVQIKIEVTPVLRGCVYAPVMMGVSEKTEDRFGFAEINTLSFADLYAGKIMAALDRQHPRDLFDIHLLLNTEGITDELRTALVVYLIAHGRPPQTLLAPTLKDIAPEFRHNFQGMTEDDIELAVLLEARAALIEDIRANMSVEHKQFLVSFYRREPDWDLIAADGVSRLPAVRWREQNLDKAGADTREEIVTRLEQIFDR